MRLQRFFFDGLILSSLALLACEAPPVEPIPGGGVRGAFAGELTVLVIDERGGAIEGAAILGGEGEDARSLGVTGVPLFLFEGKFAVSGAQPQEAFDAAIDEVAERTGQQPITQLAAPAEGCDDDGYCAV